MKNKKENIRKGIYKYSNTYKYLNISIYKITNISLNTYVSIHMKHLFWLHTPKNMWNVYVYKYRYAYMYTDMYTDLPQVMMGLFNH